MISFLLMYSVKEYACVCLYTHCNKTSVACSAMAISVKLKSSDLMCLDLKEKKSKWYLLCVWLYLTILCL